jgi:hypothetical protein
MNRIIFLIESAHFNCLMSMEFDSTTIHFYKRFSELGTERVSPFNLLYDKKSKISFQTLKFSINRNQYFKSLF